MSLLGGCGVMLMLVSVFYKLKISISVPIYNAKILDLPVSFLI